MCKHLLLVAALLGVSAPVFARTVPRFHRPTAPESPNRIVASPDGNLQLSNSEALYFYLWIFFNTPRPGGLP